MPAQRVIIIGGGLAGFTAARELRTRGFAGELTIIDPQGLPYDRPPLSKQYLLGTYDQEKILLAPESWYQDNAVEVLVAEVTDLDPESGTVTTDSGEQRTADAIVLATGGAARRLPVPGGDLDSVLTLRTREDADILRSRIEAGTRVAIIGAGLIGAEVASSLKSLGAEVTLIDPLDPPLEPAVGPEIARHLHDMHAKHGVRAVTGVSAQIEAEGSVHRIRLQDGQSIEADVVLVGIGIIPETGLAERAGLLVDNGILVDHAQRTSHRRVFAIGDCSRTRNEDGTYQRRAEHWEHAMNTGMTVASVIQEVEAPQHGAPWFWSDRYGVHVEGVGSMSAEGKTVLRQVEGKPSVALRVSEEGLLLGCAVIDDSYSVRAARRIIDRRIPMTVEQLEDPEVPLKKLARQRG
ncbi:NAD(P)/FAD-dependent oxidoreductase [Nesterenkonia muleiensis]|uniref:NAD(P)/FAD-dependent oxidoreductase n=1 Tax=Nesterenkonia muleiensis TaxID=2282648 RepID=UPI000E734BD6|nr:FAD-dependent oxidoreductase [Nesterenkonia muleiensis]